MATNPSRVQREIRQTVPFRSRAQQALVGLLRTADVVRRRLAGVIEPFGVTLQQYNVLRILRGAGPEGLPTLEIGERMLEHAPGITRLIDRLERKGLVHRERCPTDRRQVTCRIHRRGLDLLQRLDPEVDRSDEMLNAVLSQGDQQRLIALLDDMRSGLVRES